MDIQELLQKDSYEFSFHDLWEILSDYHDITINVRNGVMSLYLDNKTVAVFRMDAFHSETVLDTIKRVLRDVLSI